MYKSLFVSVLILFPLLASAAAPTCHSHSSGNYCQYTGLVKRIYVNSGNLILIYFDAPVDVATANGYGMGISNGSAAAFSVSDNPEFAKLFYSTALSAQASGRAVSIQMRSNQSGYLKFDRIWLESP